MNHTSIEWVRNPDGSQGYTWNPITGCLNGCPYCYARKLSNGWLKARYLANNNIAPNPARYGTSKDPFYPRFWPDRLDEDLGICRGIFVCDMSDLFGIGIPDKWTWQVLDRIKRSSHRNRYFLLTKQPQNLVKFSPFPDNAWVGVSATNTQMFIDAGKALEDIEAKVKYISAEPLLDWGLGGADFIATMLQQWGINWIIIGAQTKPKKIPQWDWVREIINASLVADIPIFLKNNLGLPKWSCEGAMPFYKKDSTGTMVLRQCIDEVYEPELPEIKF